MAAKKSEQKTAGEKARGGKDKRLAAGFGLSAPAPTLPRPPPRTQLDEARAERFTQASPPSPAPASQLSEPPRPPPAAPLERGAPPKKPARRASAASRPTAPPDEGSPSSREPSSQLRRAERGERVTVYLPGDLATELRVKCARERRSMSDALTAAVERWVRGPAS